MYLKKNKISKNLVNISNLIFSIGIFLSILIIIYSLYRIFNPIYDYSLGNKGINNFYLIIISLGIILLLLLLIGIFKLRDDIKLNLAIIFILIVVTVYGFEIYFNIPKKTDAQIAAKNLGVSYDNRTKKELRDDLRLLGVETLPNMHGYYWMEENGFQNLNGRIYPLGTVSNSKTILHNQAGFYPVIETDEHGFHNPKGLYQKNKVDIIITGDSFAEGYAVNSDQNISAYLRNNNFHTITLGKGGNGPLLEFATLKEYAEPLKPKIVLWFYFGNDLNNLSSEIQSTILMQYFDDINFSQKLIKRQKEIDETLMRYVNQRWKQEEEKQWQRESLSSKYFIKILKLYNLRKTLELIPKAKTKISSDDQGWKKEPQNEMFVRILDKSKKMINKWGGKMYFVYLPAYGRYAKGFEHPDYTGIEIENRDFVISATNEIGIPIIDIHKEIFEHHDDPLSLFPLRMNGHYNTKGQRLVADVIIKRLNSDGYLR